MEFSAINFSNLQICEEKYVPHFSKFFQIIEFLILKYMLPKIVLYF